MLRHTFIDTRMQERTSAVRRYFSTAADYLANDFVVRIRTEIVTDLLRDASPRDVLDVGCGDGRIGAALLGSGTRVTFLDPSVDMIRLARSRIPARDLERCTFIQGTLEAIRADRRFDTVLCLGVLAHVEAIADTVRSLSAVVRDGGSVLIQITDLGSFAGRTIARLSAWRERHWPKQAYFYNEVSVAGLASVANDHGLVLAKVSRYTAVPGMTRVLPDWLLYRMSALSRRWPCNLAGGEVVAQFHRA